MPAETAREIRTRARNLAWERIAPAEAFDQNPSQEAIRISDTIARIQEHLQEKARIAQNARNAFVAEKVRDVEQHSLETSGRGRTGIELSNPETREKFVQSIIANLPPEEVKKLAALDRYAAETREAVYQGVETLDAERRALELSHIQVQTLRAQNFDHFRFVEIRSLDNAEVARPSQFEPQLLSPALAELGTQLDNVQNDRHGVNFLKDHVDGDREWQFDTLRDVLNTERFGNGEPHMEHIQYSSHSEDRQITFDR